MSDDKKTAVTVPDRPAVRTSKPPPSRKQTLVIKTNIDLQEEEEKKREILQRGRYSIIVPREVKDKKESA